MSKLKDLTGCTFGRLTVIRRDLTRGTKKTYWLCQCICGQYKSVVKDNLLSGNTQSCGCYNSEAVRKRNTIHGHNQQEGASPEYVTWCAMKNRCNNKNVDNYRFYGGRGIKICKRWDESFKQFLEDMGTKPSPEFTIDRIDVNGDYEPGNCRWADKETQFSNTRHALRRDVVSL